MDPNLSNGGSPSRGSPLNGKIMLSAIVVLFAIVVFILFLHLYVRWHVLRRATRRFRRRRRLILAGESQIPASSSSNRRLDPSILKSLPVLLFSSGADGDDGDELVECAVCLNEFEEGEKIRCLPRCGHGFHIDCIDMWFCSHSNCPLCRAEVEAVEPNLIPADDPPVMPARPDLCSTCRREEDMGASSSDAGGCEVRIQVPSANSLAGGSQEEQPSLGFESGEQQALKLASSRIFLIWWLLMRRIHRSGALVSDPDLESGDVAFRPPPPPPPPAPAPASTR